MNLQRITRPLRWINVFNLTLLTLLVVALTAYLWPQWRQNPDLSHGPFMPLLFFALLYESRTNATPRYPRAGAGKTTLLLVLLIGGLAALCAGGLYASAVSWGYALAAFSLTLATVLLLGAGLLVLSDPEVRLMPLNWTALVAIGLWLLCTPLPPGTYSRLTLSLQLAVTGNVLGALHLLGIAASRHGNIIELATTAVGVEEACSGVRSLISCVFAGLFFSATLVHRPWARAILILLAAPLALLMNFIRSLTLTLLANSGVNISGLWHDATGFAVLGVTAVILGGLALLLEHSRPPAPPAVAREATPPPVRFPQVALGTGLVLALTLGGFFFEATHSDVSDRHAAPDLATLLPGTAPGWEVKTSHDLYQFTDVLLTQNLAQRSYFRQSAQHGIIQLTVYLAYWRAGQASVSQVAMHTPDACWPGAGWTPQPIATPRELLAVAGHVLPTAEARKFDNGAFHENVWFWHLYDRQPTTYENPRSPAELLRNAWRYGFRREGDQLFVRFSSNQPWSVLQDEPLVAEIFQKLQPLGL